MTFRVTLRVTLTFDQNNSCIIVFLGSKYPYKMVSHINLRKSFFNIIFWGGRPPLGMGPFVEKSGPIKIWIQQPLKPLYAKFHALFPMCTTWVFLCTYCFNYYSRFCDNGIGFIEICMHSYMLLAIII